MRSSAISELGVASTTFSFVTASMSAGSLCSAAVYSISPGRNMITKSGLGLNVSQ